MASKAAREEKEALAWTARRRLHEYLSPGSRVWTVRRHTSSSGMSHAISPVVMTDVVPSAGPMYWAPYDVSYLVAPAIGSRVHATRGGVVVGGAGMDMGFHLVYTLSRVLWSDGFDCIGAGCPSNDHTNREDNTHHRDGGYALRHNWL